MFDEICRLALEEMARRFLVDPDSVTVRPIGLPVVYWEVVINFGVAIYKVTLGAKGENPLVEEIPQTLSLVE